MPTETLNNSEFAAFPTLVALKCIQLDLSTGDNTFDLSQLDQENSPCCQVMNTIISVPDTRVHITAELHSAFDSLTIHIPEFDVVDVSVNIFGIPIEVKLGTVRLSHLVMTTMTLSWSAAYGGSLVVHVELHGQHDIQGDFQGNLTNAQLTIYLPVSLSPDCSGQLVVSAVATFDFNLSIDDVPESAVQYVRGQIHDMIVNTIQEQMLQPDPGQTHNRATRLVLGTLSPTPPATAAYSQFAIRDGTATVSWGDTLGHATVTVESVQPDYAPSDEMFHLFLGVGWRNWNCSSVKGAVAGPASVFTPLPLSVSVPIPGDTALSMDIKTYKTHKVGSTWKPEGGISSIESVSTSPGTYTQPVGQFVVTYTITMT